MNTERITLKRRRKEGDTNSATSKPSGSNHDKQCKRDESTSTAPADSMPSWARTNDCSLIPSSKLVYGMCPNVSSRYEKLGRIGEGTYGVVYRARDKVTKEIVALKRCLPHHEASDGFPLTTLREITLLRELQDEGRNNGIVIMKDVAVSSSRSGVFLVFEYAQHDLATLIDHHYKEHNCSPFRESEVKRLMLQLLGALSFLHSRHILHRDLKLSNLLYNHRGELRVADFGLARRVGGEFVGDNWSDSKEKNCCLTPKVVSLWYRPPELLFGSEYYDMGVDNWGAGCSMGELLLGKPLMNGKNELDQVQKMFDFLGPPNSDDWPELKELPLLKNGSIEIPKRWHVQNGTHMLDIFRTWRSASGIKLLSGLLKYNPKDRWTADEALAANYFSEMPAATPLSLMPTFPTKHK